jgi:multicomponent Na+:H+ antiporter subunit E
MMRKRIPEMAISFGLLGPFWVLLSGYFDAFHLAAGGGCAMIVTVLSHRLLFPERRSPFLRTSWRLLCYIPWELWQIVLSNIDVIRRVLDPKMPIAPCLVEIETPLRSEFALVTLGNSITLTPGTITVSVDPERGAFLVHALAKEPADALRVDQTMQRRVAEVFQEGQEAGGGSP